MYFNDQNESLGSSQAVRFPYFYPVCSEFGETMIQTNGGPRMEARPQQGQAPLRGAGD
jgi:hypothetical protein